MESSRPKEATPLEQAVSRAMRDNLALVQHTAKELGQAIEDFVAACGSSRNANMLPSMLRAQTAAASLTSMLEVLSRTLTASLQPPRTGSSEAYLATMPMEAAAAEPAAARPAPPPPPRVVVPKTLPVVPEIPESPEAVAIPSAPPVVPEAPPPPPPAPEPKPEPAATEPPPPPPPVEEPAPAPPPAAETAPEPEPVAETQGGPLVPPEATQEIQAPAAYDYPPVEAERAPEHAPSVEVTPAPPSPVTEHVPESAPAPEPQPVAVAAAAASAPAATWRVEDLPPDQQELHRRANRHAKVSMQDIYLLRPKDVQAARAAKDICGKLKGDIEKARKEYVRRFGPILEHPVDYFHHWMVEVLAEGKPEILGEYPYPSAAPRR